MRRRRPARGGEQKIKRLEAHGDVVVTQKDQTATGDIGVFDMKTNTVTLTGNVVVTQGQNVLRGEQLVVDLTTGVSRVELPAARTAGCRACSCPAGALSVPAQPGKAAATAARNPMRDTARPYH